MISADAKPKLPRGVRLTHNEAQGGWVLLAPERRQVEAAGFEVAADGLEIRL